MVDHRSDKDVGGGASLTDIEQAETTLGVTLPQSYRSFLQHCGWARFSYQELYGLGADVPRHLDLIRNTVAERTEMMPLLPTALVLVMNDGAGNHY